MNGFKSFVKTEKKAVKKAPKRATKKTKVVKK